MEVTAQLNGLRLAPRKVRAVVDLIKKKDAVVALDQLAHMIRRPAPQLAKLIKSGIANAENTYHMVRENLYIKKLVVDEGMKLRRFMPRAQGRATEIQKKTCYVRLTLDERVPGMKRSVAPAKDKDAEVKETKEKTETKKSVVKAETTKGAAKEGVVRKFFNRKAV